MLFRSLRLCGTRTGAHQRKQYCRKNCEDREFVFNKFILHEKKYQRVGQSDTDVLQRAHYKACPLQRNGFDCGIFAVGATLHLAERISLTSKSFSQTHVTKARSELAKTFAKSGALMASSVSRDCFPLLRGRSIVDHAMGFEVITRVDGLTRPAAAYFRCSTKGPVIQRCLRAMERQR